MYRLIILLPFLCLLIGLFSATLNAQIKAPRAPGFPVFEPIQPGRSPRPMRQGPPANLRPPAPHGNHADDIQRRLEAQMRIGPKSQQEIIRETEARYQQQAHWAAYKRRRDNHTEQIIEEIRAYRPKPAGPAQAAWRRYQQARAEIVAMLVDSLPLSVNRAAWLVEWAHSGAPEWQDWNRQIGEIVSLVESQTPDSANNAAKIQALNSWFRDTTFVNGPDGQKQIAHLPYRYDFVDFGGEENYRNLFVCKLLETNKGQCRSLPLLYKILADELGASAQLAFAPRHSFIMHRDAAGRYRNLELTQPRYVETSAFLESGYVKAEALRNGIYLKPLSQKETIAHLLTELAQAFYYQLDQTDQADFVLNCCAEAAKHYPQSLKAKMLTANVHTHRFYRAYIDAGNPPPEEAEKNAALMRLLKYVDDSYNLMDQTGYEPMPDEAYEKWLDSIA